MEWIQIIVEKIGIPFIKKVLTSILSYVKSKKDRSKVIFPKDQNEFKKILPALDKLKDIPELWELNEIRNFYENYDVLEIEGRYGIIDKKASEEIIISKLRESKEKDTKQEINLISSEDIENFNSFKNYPKYTKKSIAEITNFLNIKYQSLLSLAIHIENLYEQNRVYEAIKVKKSVKQRYDEKGLKFCNCYQRGYIERLIMISSKYAINDKLDWFLGKSIFFVYSEMSSEDIEGVRYDIQRALNKNEDYIALHSLGSATYLAKYIVENIIVPENIEYEVIKIDKKKIIKKAEKKEKLDDFSMIWYLEGGKSIFELIKDLL